jgi:polyisoprenoid-binding protein YceI
MATQYEIDPAHSSLQFSVRHMMVSNARGTFSGVKGTVTYDPANPSALSVNATVDASSINSNDAQRDAHLKSADFFDVAQYPTITFKSSKAEKKGDGEYSISGDLTLHGVTKPVTLQVEEVTEQTKDPWGNQRLGASVKTKLKRSEFGLTWNTALETGGVVVGDEVKLDFEIQMIKAKSATA